MDELSPIQARVLGCLMEKKETTPDQYPLTLNALRNACNQKTSRNPVTTFSEGEVGHTVRELEGLGLVREQWGARAPKYEHLAGRALNLHSKGIALMCALMLRGPQTPGELKNNTRRLFEFDDLDDVLYALRKLQNRDPALVAEYPRQSGQKEDRYAHLLCGKPDFTEPVTRAGFAATGNSQSGLEARVLELESELADIKQRLAALEGDQDREARVL